MGNSSSNPYDNLPIIIQKNKETINLINKKINFNLKRMDNEKKLSLDCIKNNNKKLAIFHLKKKKMIDKQNDVLSSYLLNLEKQGFLLEDYILNKKIIDTIKRNKMTMNLINFNIDKIDNMIESINQKIILNEDLNNILSNPLGNDFDEDELLKELSEIDDKKENIKSEIILPEVPKDSLKKKNSEEEVDEAIDNLEKLMI
jgi:charged multivesicular body protein 4